MQYVKQFKELNKDSVEIAGGKGASLGEMLQAGIPVPDGFVVLSTTFDLFLQKTNLVEDIDAILDAVDHKAIHSVDAASEKIQDLIKHADFPEDIATEIKSEFKILDSEFVAVRSSATSEDGSDHAWAGQLDSYLNTTEDKVLEKVQDCWASLFTPRAIFYRFEKGLHTTKISVAVVVQQMVNSELSGIAFSVHPVTEDRNQLIIEAGFGLGEAIVSGSVTPDSYVVEKEPRRIIDISVSNQSRALYRKAGGGNEWIDLEAVKANSQVLNESQILEFSKIVLTIENHYGFPCDIEWAYEAGKFYIVQSRPITTLKNITIEPEQTIFISPELKDFNPADYHFDGLWKNDLFATCFWQDCWVPDVAKEMNLDLDGVGVMNLKGGHFLVHKPTRARMDQEIKKLIDQKDEKFFKNLVVVADKIFTWALEKGEELHSKEATVENFRDFVATAKKLNFLWLIGATYTNWPIEEKLQDAVIADNFPAEHVMDIIPKIITPLTHYQEGLNTLKKVIGEKTFEEIKKDAGLFAQLEKHAKEFVWVEIFNFIGEPMTAERLYNQVQHLDASHIETTYVPDKPLSQNLQFAVACMHDAGYVKQGGAEYFSISAERVLPFLRAVAEKIGVTYREFMCLLTEEIDLALQGKITSEELKKKAAGRIGVNDWAVIGGEDGKMIFIDEPADIKLLVEKMIPRTGEGTKELIGQIGNRGTYTGPVRIVMNTYDFDKLQPGDVLVTTMTTPDFIVLMQKSGAIITDIGGLLCHAAIVSRELKKPCIIGTKFATQLLKDGDMVEVDADNGVVRILEQKNIVPSDYIRMFSQKSFPYLFSNIFIDYYKNLEVLSVQGSGSWISFFPKSLITKTNKEGKELYTNLKTYTEYKKNFDEYFIRSTDYFELTLTKEQISSEDVKRFFELVAELFLYYSKTEFFYTDGVNEKNMAIPVKEFDELKLNGRAYLNRIFFESNGYIKSLLKKIASQINVKEMDLLYYKTKELADLIENKRPLPIEEIIARKIYFEGGNQVLFGNDAKELTESFLLDYLQISNIIKGITANKGKVTGKARVLIPDPKNFDKIQYDVKEMQEGEILIAETTSPDIIVACHKAAAIVTNQGGQLSHAAIISRELKIPCVIGTDKDVVLNIKTGDMVEVDADNGMVRILK